MKCKEYQELISPYLDGELSAAKSNAFQSHLSLCADCALAYEDFASIIDISGETLGKDSAPENSKALWCRISNIVESDFEQLAKVETEKMKPGVLRRFTNFSLQLSSAQVFTSVLGIALISSLLTVIGISNFAPPNEIHSGAELEPSVFETVLAKIGIVEGSDRKHQRKLEEQKSTIAYWEKRVELKRTQWESNLREAYDRNLKEIDRVVIEYTQIVEKDPTDKISNEMLNSALFEKMEFLREFAEL